MNKLRSLCRDTTGSAFVELGISLPLITFMLFGVITGALVFDRYMTVVQLGRNAAGMMSRGMDFSRDANKSLLLTGQSLDISLNDGQGVIYLTRVTVAPSGTRNAGSVVMAERHVIGNDTFQASSIGQPSAAIWPDPSNSQPNGDVKDYNEEPSAVASVPQALATLPPGESMYVAEVYHTAESLRFGRAWGAPLTISTVIYF